VLHELAAATGQSFEQVLESYRRQRFHAGPDAAYAPLRADPVAWDGELAERAQPEGTFADRIHDL
jgi:hypothetical protein